MPYTVTPTALPEVLILEPKALCDDRGFFFESFNQRDFQQATGLDGRAFRSRQPQQIQPRGTAWPVLLDSAPARQAGAGDARGRVRCGG